MDRNSLRCQQLHQFRENNVITAPSAQPPSELRAQYFGNNFGLFTTTAPIASGGTDLSLLLTQAVHCLQRMDGAAGEQMQHLYLGSFCCEESDDRWR